MTTLISADLTNSKQWASNKQCILQYTTTDGKILSTNGYGEEVVDDEAFDANVVSHTYTDVGRIIFDKPITIIRNFAFQFCANLTSIIIPDGVTKIGRCAFYRCTRLTNITIPKSVTEIGEDAFSICISATNIFIP